MGGLVAAMVLAIYSTNTRLASNLTMASYNWLYELTRFRQVDMTNTDVVLVYIDEGSHVELGQSFIEPWDRSIHARLLDRLTDDEARLVIFDVVFSDPGPNPDADDRFEAAIRRNGRTVLAADHRVETQSAPGELTAVISTTIYPVARFADAAAGIGLTQIWPDEDFVARRHLHGVANEELASLAWTGSRLAAAAATLDAKPTRDDPWIHYYGLPGALPNVSYSRAIDPDGVPPGFFRNKIVWVGARPMPGLFNERRDELRSPYAVFHREIQFMPAVEVHATQMLNLLRGDYLRRIPPAFEMLLLLASSLGTAFGVRRLRPVLIAAVSLGAMLLAATGSAAVFLVWSHWSVWLLILLLPVLLSGTAMILYRSLEWYRHRQRLEAAQRAAHARIAEQAALLDKAHDAIIVHDFHWKVTYWNQGAELTYGWKSAETVGLDIRQVIGAEGSAKFDEAKETVLIQDEWTGEMIHRHRNQKRLNIESRWSLVRDAAGNPASVLVINSDVTERKLIEAQLLRTQRMESIGTLAGGIAHDLNNVLAPIMMGIDLLNMRVDEDGLRSVLDRMAGSARRGADLVKQVLTFARGHEGEKTVVQLAHLLKEMNKIVVETFPRNITIQTSASNKLWPVMADATQLHQVLLNLCVNARDAMPDGGTITIEAENMGEAEILASGPTGLKRTSHVRFSVRDTGTGIPDEVREKIFEPFFTTKEVGKGTGLGLSTVITIVKNHGGLLDLKSEVGRGTTFSIYLPAAQDAVAAAEAPVNAEELRGGGELVLVVDDEPAIRELVATALMDHGYGVVTANNGAEAIELYDGMSDRIAVLVTDA